MLFHQLLKVLFWDMTNIEHIQYSLRCLLCYELCSLTDLFP